MKNRPQKATWYPLDSALKEGEIIYREFESKAAAENFSSAKHYGEVRLVFGENRYPGVPKGWGLNADRWCLIGRKRTGKT